MPRAGTTDIKQHWLAVHAATQSDEYREAEYPEDLIKFKEENKKPLRNDAYYDWCQLMQDAGTADRCGRCRRVRFGAPECDFQKGTEDTEVYNTQWAFIPQGRKVCVACSAKQKAKLAARPKPPPKPRPTPTPLAYVSASPVTENLLQQMLTLMQEQKTLIEQQNEQIRQLNETQDAIFQLLTMDDDDSESETDDA